MNRGAELPALLDRMQDVLDRALAKAEAAMRGAEAEAPQPATLKTFADLVALIARAAEKIHEMRKAANSEADAAAGLELSPAERAALEARVEGWIEERAERRAEAMLAERNAKRRRRSAGSPPVRKRVEKPARNQGGAPSNSTRVRNGNAG